MPPKKGKGKAKATAKGKGKAVESAVASGSGSEAGPSAVPASDAPLTVTYYDSQESALGAVMRQAYFDRRPFVRSVNGATLLPIRFRDLHHAYHFLCFNPLPAACGFHCTVSYVEGTGRYAVEVASEHSTACSADPQRVRRAELIPYPMPPDTARFVGEVAEAEVRERRSKGREAWKTPRQVWTMIKARGLEFKYSALFPDGLWKRALVKAENALLEAEQRGEGTTMVEAEGSADVDAGEKDDEEAVEEEIVEPPSRKGKRPRRGR